MRYRNTGLAFRRSIAAAALIAAAASLAGCSSLGSGGFIDSTTTGSTGRAVGVAAAQQMPAPLVSQAKGDGPYIPPADVGRRIIVMPTTTGSVAQQPTTTGVSSQPLPPLVSSGSQQTMPAQAAVKVASSPTPAAATAPQVSVTKPTTPTGPVHIVSSGESLYVIARRYHVEPSTIVKANDLSSMDKIFIGQKLIIPGGEQTDNSVTTASISTPKAVPVVAKPVVEPVAKPVAAKSALEPVAKPVAEPPKTVARAPAVTEVAPIKAQPADGKFRWPVSGTVITDFAESRSGINIAAQEGTAVRAAESGTVIYTGSAVQGYGNLVLIKHANGYVSAYAHLKDITVTKGMEVNRGEAIGTMGMTGGVSRPQLHFELRKGATPVDPTPLLAG